MVVPDELRQKLNQRLINPSKIKGLGGKRFCEISGVNKDTLRRLLAGLPVSESTIQKATAGIVAYDKFVIEETERQKQANAKLTKELEAVL